MIRAKQLNPLSQSARSFFFNGSRCSAGDESPCSCADEETCSSNRIHRGDVRRLQVSSPFVLKSSVGVGLLTSTDSRKAVNAEKHGNVPFSQEIPVSRSLVKSASAADGSVAQDVMHSSPSVADQFVKGGIAVVNILSDLVNYRIPITDQSSILGTPPSCMVERTKPISNTGSENAKTFRKDKVDQKSISGVAPGSKCASASNISRCYSDTSSADKGVRNVSSNESGSLSETCRWDRKMPMPQRSSAHSYRSIPNEQQAEGKFIGHMVSGFNKKQREARVIPGASVPKQSKNYTNVVESVSHILHQFKWSLSAQEAIAKLDIVLDAFQANQILKKLQDHTVAVDFFFWLKRQPGFRHDGHSYTTMVGILGRARQFGMIKNLLDQMIVDGCKPNVVTYNRLIHSYGRANYLEEAIDVFNQMQNAGCEPDRVTFCTLIDIHAKAGYLDTAIDLYNRMQEAGLSPDTFTYSVIINCLGKAGHLAGAHKLFHEMVNKGCAPNLVTYNIMIALHAKARNYQSALQLYRDMQSAGFKPDRVTYSIVMEVLGHSGYLNEAEAVFADMKNMNWVPDEPVYGLLVDLWGKASNAEKAWEWYRAMLNAGLRPNVPTCNSLLGAFLRVHRLHDAYNLLLDMQGLGLNPSVQTYTLLLSCCTEAQTALDMAFCGKLMTVTGHPIHTFLLSMPAPGPDGQNVRDHVSVFLDKMHAEDRESKRGLVDAVINFFHKTGLKEEAGSVWEVAAQKNLYPDAVKERSSCYWLINLHVMSEGTAVTALSRSLAWFRSQMLISGICPSRIDIITGWGRRSRVRGASTVRQAVQELLDMFNFPFFTENGNFGCFVGCGDPLNRWLLQSYVERMHLL